MNFAFPLPYLRDDLPKQICAVHAFRQRFIGQSNAMQQDVFSEVAKFETPDDYTLKVSLTQPLIDFPRNIAAWSFIWPKEQLDNLDYLKEHAVGTGPFIQQSWEKKDPATSSEGEFS